MIITFLLMMVMVGVAVSVLIASQGDLQVSAVDRTQNEAFYMAETGVAYAKDRLFAVGAQGSWNAIISPAQPSYGNYNDFRCVWVGGTDGWAAPANAVKRPPVPNVGSDYVEYSYCVHNNADDPSCFKPCPGNNCKVPTPHVCNNPQADIDDADGFITIEAFADVKNGPGACDGVTVICLDHKRLSVDVATSAPLAVTTDYAQAGGSSKARQGDSKVNMNKFTFKAGF